MKQKFELDKSAQKRQKLIHIFAIVCIVGILVSIIPDIYFGLWYSALSVFATIIGFLIIIWVNRKDIILSANLFILNMVVMIFYYTYALGKESNMPLMLFLIIIGSSFIIDYRRKKLIYFHLIHPPLFYIFFEFTNYKIWFIPPLAGVNPEHIKVFGTINLMILFLFIPLISLVILRTQLLSEAEIKEANEKLQKQNSELQENNEELDKFAFRVSHDLRSPIASVKGLLGILEKEEDLPTIKNYHQLMKKSLHRLEDFIKEILDQSQNNRTDLKLEVVDLQKLIQEVYQQLAFTDLEKEIKLNIELSPHSPNFISDANRLKIIFHNLISNAIRYQNPQNQFTEISISAKIETQKALIQVKDNGLGIAEQHISKVFDMFYRANSHTSGSGLGLYLVKQCVDKLGGEVELTSQENQGTIFSISLPNYR